MHHSTAQHTPQNGTTHTTTCTTAQRATQITAHHGTQNNMHHNTALGGATKCHAHMQTSFVTLFAPCLVDADLAFRVLGVCVQFAQKTSHYPSNQ